MFNSARHPSVRRLGLLCFRADSFQGRPPSVLRPPSMHCLPAVLCPTNQFRGGGRYTKPKGGRRDGGLIRWKQADHAENSFCGGPKNKLGWGFHSWPSKGADASTSRQCNSALALSGRILCGLTLGGSFANFCRRGMALLILLTH